MSRDRYTIHDPDGNPIAVTIRRDKRLKKSARWVREKDGRITMRVPYRIPQHEIARLLGGVESQLDRQRHVAERRTDADLQVRAEYINRKHFEGEISWAAIRWVSNMTTRLGSCTNGGPTDGHIRISDKIRDWPQWVIDYVIAHELTHRLHNDHSPEFWAYLEAAYPLTERARGFVQGVGFARGEALGEDD